MRALVASIVRYGLPLVFGNVFLEQIGLPIPALPTLIGAGAVAANGKLSALAVLGLAVAASVAADTIWFWLGRAKGDRVLKTLCRISLSPDSCVKETESLFERRGAPSLLYAKFVPGFSTVAPPMAGLMRVPLATFLLFDSAGALLWAGSGVAAGLVFHDAIDRAAALAEGLGFWAVVAAGLALAAFIGMKWRERRRFYRRLRLARVTVADLKALLDGEESPIVVDVRSRSSALRNPRRIPGARHIDMDDADAAVGGLPRDRDIVLYCT